MLRLLITRVNQCLLINLSERLWHYVKQILPWLVHQAILNTTHAQLSIAMSLQSIIHQCWSPQGLKAHRGQYGMSLALRLKSSALALRIRSFVLALALSLKSLALALAFRLKSSALPLVMPWWSGAWPWGSRPWHWLWPGGHCHECSHRDDTWLPDTSEYCQKQ